MFELIVILGAWMLIIYLLKISSEHCPICECSPCDCHPSSEVKV